MPRTTRHHGRWTMTDRIASAWHYLPVEVPAGSHGLRVELEYDRSAAVLDLGCTGPAGFRGWSGGARRSFVITADAATPGYLGGELEPGTWQVLIAIHRLPPQRVDHPLEAQASNRPGQLPLDPRHPAPPPLPRREPSPSAAMPRQRRQP